MREKDDILNDARRDIALPKYKAEAHLWLEFRKIEVLLDIREALLSFDDKLSNYERKETK